VIAGAVTSPWIIRNAVVFGKVIPIKSNAAFELYQSLVDEPTGLVTMWSLTTSHPMLPYTKHGLQYRKLGESTFLDELGAEARRELIRSPGTYAACVVSRLAATTVDLPHVIPFLAESWFHRLCWWLYPIAFFGWLWSLIDPPHVRSRLIAICQVTYVVYLIPYVMVSFYGRYAVPLLLLRCVFTSLFLIRLCRAVNSLVVSLMKKQRKASGSPRRTGRTGTGHDGTGAGRSGVR
jgi:hypothetical protein